MKLVDLSAVLSTHRAQLDLMLEYDLEALDAWVEPMRESVSTWTRFVRAMADSGMLSAERDHERMMFASLMHTGNQLASTAEQTLWIYEAVKERASVASDIDERRERVAALVAPYLRYVNANLVLTTALDVGFHDWADFQPFYRRKFASVGHPADPSRDPAEQSRRLFELAFPEAAIADTATFLRTMRDKRIVKLRELITDAVAGKVQFDDEFAQRTLQEVLRVQQRVERFRTVVSYLTAPLWFLPGLIGNAAQKAIEEVAGALYSRTLKREHQWFYLLSDVQRGNERKQLETKEPPRLPSGTGQGGE